MNRNHPYRTVAVRVEVDVELSDAYGLAFAVVARDVDLIDARSRTRIGRVEEHVGPRESSFTARTFAGEVVDEDVEDEDAAVAQLVAAHFASNSAEVVR